MKLTKEQAEAWNRYSHNFNNLPYEIRKALPDLTQRIQEIQYLIHNQENVLYQLRQRQNMLLGELVKWNEEVNVIGDIPNYENTYLTRKEVSDLIGVSLMTLHRWEKDKILVPMRFGHSVRYKLSDIQKMGGEDDDLHL